MTHKNSFFQSKKHIFIWIFMAFIACCLLFGCSSYNHMVEMEEGVQNAWGQVENQYQRRLDLIPNLVNTVKGYAEHEQETLTQVIEARSKATQLNIDPSQLNANNFAQFERVQQELSSSLSKLMLVVERYPELKANQNFLALQSQLEGTENRISVERRRFNESIKEYNKYIRRFPQNFVARMLDFDKKEYFHAQKEAEKAPSVQF